MGTSQPQPSANPILKIKKTTQTVFCSFLIFFVDLNCFYDGNYSRSQAEGVTVDAQFLTVTSRLKAEGV